MLSLAPPQPDPFEIVMAKRSSCAPVHRAVLPPRECPRTATRFASSSGRVSIQSITRLKPHAHAPIVPQLVGVRVTARDGTEKQARYVVNDYWKADTYKTVTFRVRADVGDTVTVTAENAYGMASQPLQTEIDK